MLPCPVVVHRIRIRFYADLPRTTGTQHPGIIVAAISAVAMPLLALAALQRPQCALQRPWRPLAFRLVEASKVANSTGGVQSAPRLVEAKKGVTALLIRLISA